MRPSPDHDHLMALAAAADADLSAIGADGAILRLSDLVALPEAFTWFPLEGSHPLDLLLGFRAPPHWRALGVSCDGRTHRLDASGRYDDTAADSEDVTVTILVGRDGAAAGVLRRGGEVTPQPGRPQGAVADACRRALGVATAPPPSSTLGLWTLSWLDRIVDVATRADGAARLRSWAAVAELHAATGLDGHGAVATSAPVALAASAATLAEAWPWARLRAEPAVVDVPGPRLGQGGGVDGRRHVGTVAAVPPASPRRSGGCGARPAAPGPRRGRRHRGRGRPPPRRARRHAPSRVAGLGPVRHGSQDRA